MACSKDDSGVDVKEVVVDSLTWEELENKRTILYVDENRMESNDTIVDRDLRTFSTKELIKIETNSEGTGFCLTSWVCDTLNNVFLMAHPQGSGDSYILFYIDMLPPLAQFDYEIPYENGSLTIYNREDQPATIAPGDGTTFSIETEDPLWKKLTEDIKINWTASFSNYEGAHWSDEMTALYAREWVVILTNMAYMYSTPEFEYILYHWEEVLPGYPTIGDNGKAFTAEQYDQLYKRETGERDLVLGFVIKDGVNGMGGAGVLAANHTTLYSHYNSMVNHAWNTIAHEFNHQWYGHNSSLCPVDYVVGVGSFPQTMVPQLHNYLRKAKRLPYTNMFVFNFPAYNKIWWKATDFSNMGYDPETLEFYNSKSVFTPVEQWLNDNASLFQ